MDPKSPRPRKLWVMVVVLLVAHGILLLSSVRTKTNTFDEPAYLAGGLSYWQCNDYRLNPEAGNLPQRWATLPLWLAGYEVPEIGQEHWRKSQSYHLGWKLLYDSGHDAQRLLLMARSMIAVASMMLGLLLFVWARRLFGVPAGLLALALYALCPTTLAHGALVTSDLFVSLGFVLVLYAMTHLLLRPITLWRVFVSCLVVVVLLLSKVSGLLIVPLALVLVALRVIDGRALRIAGRRPRLIRGRPRLAGVLALLVLLHALVAWGGIWASVGFRHAAMRHAAPGRDQLNLPWRDLLEQPTRIAAASAWLSEHRALPEAYAYGVAYVSHFSRSRHAFLAGEYSSTGFAAFFPYAFAVKTPLGLFPLLVLGLSGAWTWAHRRTAGRRRTWRRLRPLIPLLLFVAVYWLLAVRSHLNIGHRHLLPVYPVFYVLAGAALWGAPRLLSPRGVVVLLFAATFALESLLVYPHYLAFFNAAAGGSRQGHRHLVDSSLDWGQDLPELRRRLDALAPDWRQRGDVYLSYFGTSEPRYYGLKVQPLPSMPAIALPRLPPPLTAGFYCVSATMLQATYAPAWGPWTGDYEAQYQAAKVEVQRFEQVRHDAAAREALMREKGQSYWLGLFQSFQELRFSRLCAYLRQREPDANAGYSILIYRLTREQVDAALEAPPAELAAAPSR